MTTKRILVIDDEGGIREIIKISLEIAAGWQVETAASGQEGIALAQTQQPDAILLDLMMPEMDGCETQAQLLANPATRHIPIILLTAKLHPGEKQPFANLDLAGVITKPFNSKMLAAQIREMLKWEG